MLRITGPTEIDRFEIILKGVDKASIKTISFHMQMEEYSCNAGFVSTNEGLIIRGYFAKGDVSTYILVGRLVNKICMILRRNIVGSFTIADQIWSFEYEDV